MPKWNSLNVFVYAKHSEFVKIIIMSLLFIREYGSTLYVGMTREKNGGRMKRVH